MMRLCVVCYIHVTYFIYLHNLLLLPLLEMVKKNHSLSLRCCLNFQSSKKRTVFKFSLQQISEVVVRSSLSFTNSSYKRRLGWGQQTDGRTWQSLPFRYWHRFLFFPRAAGFCCFNLKQMHGSSLTKRKGTEEAFLKFISLPSHRDFNQLAGQDREMVISLRDRKALLHSAGFLHTGRWLFGASEGR